MGNGGTSFDMGGGDDEAAAALLDSDVGLGINMQQTQSSYYSNKNTNFISSFYHHNHNHNHLHQHQPSTEIGGGLLFGGSDSGGVMAATGKVLFTATQWQELERQTMIYKYIVASIPVPPHLLIPLSTQSNRVGMDLRFSSGSDQEPWRCRRTDGKKWRCSRDVAPDQKYCERHAHKSRPRSRKPVEIQSHNTTTTTTPATSTNTLSAATSSHQHPRCTEWFIKSGTTPLSSSNQPFQQSMHSPRVGSKRDHIFSQDSVNYSSLELNTSTSTSASGEAAAARRQQFIDAWSRSGGGDNCSLTLSMQCSSVGNGMDESLQMLDVERGGDALKWHNRWSNQASWMGSPPGGPLGEALCLGTASIAKGPLNVPSPHGYSTTSTTTSSSCENGGSYGRDR